MDILSQIPTNYEENIRWRHALLRAAEADPQVRAAAYNLFFDPERGLEFACKAFFWLHEPRKRDHGLHIVPFIPFDFQLEFMYKVLDAATRGYNITVLKSRDMGVTWSVLATFLWCWLRPEPGWSFLIGSDKEWHVYRRGDPSTLFGKLEFMLSRLPDWLKPEGFEPRWHYTKLMLRNPENHNIIVGDSTGEDFGRGERFRAAFLDEFAMWGQFDEAVYSSVQLTTDCTIIVSTPKGKNNMFYRLCSGELGSVDVIHLRSDLNPFHTPEWHEEMRRRLPPPLYAQEVECSFEGSGGQLFFSSFSDENIDSSINVIPGREVLVGFDFGRTHPCAVFTQIDDKGRWLVLRVILGGDAVLSEFAEWVWRRACEWFSPNAQFVWFVDVAGTHRSDKGTQTSVQILQQHVRGPICYKSVNRPAVAVRLHELVSTKIAGKRALLLSTFCPPDHNARPPFVQTEDMAYVAEAFRSIYIDERKQINKGIADYVKDGKFDHPIDALGFICNYRFLDTTPQDMVKYDQEFRSRNAKTALLWQRALGGDRWPMTL